MSWYQRILRSDCHSVVERLLTKLTSSPSKSPPHQSGALHASSHRLFFISGASSSSAIHAPDPSEERGASLTIDLHHVSHTESYAGFFKSSAKVTLHLRPIVDVDQRSGTRTPASTPGQAVDDAVSASAVSTSSPSPAPGVVRAPLSSAEDPFEAWDCDICDFRNPPGLSPAARNTCQLCGMPRSASSNAVNSKPITIKPPPHIARNASLSDDFLHSRSLPTSTSQTPVPFAGPSSLNTSNADLDAADTIVGSNSIACPACTFLNHASLQKCEMCGSTLGEPDGPISAASTSNAMPLAPIHRMVLSKSAPTSRPDSPSLGEVSGGVDSIGDKDRYVRLSFRKGGDKAFYAALKTAIQGRAWEVRREQKKREQLFT